jgi:hypothetical protein
MAMGETMIAELTVVRPSPLSGGIEGGGSAASTKLQFVEITERPPQSFPLERRAGVGIGLETNHAR